jgi:polysaccharide biosynthesis transport protein
MNDIAHTGRRRIPVGINDGDATVAPREGLAPPMLLQYWQVVLRWKWVIGVIILASLATGLIATLMMTPKFTATSRIEISRDQKNVTNVEGVDSGDAGRDLEFYQTQYSLLSARSVAERVAKTMRLASNDDFFRMHGTRADNGSIFFTQTGRPASPKELEKREELAVELLLDNVSISPIRGSALTDIRYTSSDPQMAARIANVWTQEFIRSSMGRKYESTADARKFLESRLADLRARLETSERDVVAYASQNDIVALGKSKSSDGKTEIERTLVSSDLEALNEALTKATADRMAAESRIRQHGSVGANSEALNNVAISSLRQKRAEVAAEYAKLMVQFEPGFPAARALAEQVRALDASITREESRVQSSRVSEYREAIGRETSLRNRVGELKGTLDRQQRSSIQYNIYQREADTNRQLYDGLLQRYKEIGVAGIGSNNISVVDTAKVPNRPSSPRLLVNMALASFAGLLLS